MSDATKANKTDCRLTIKGSNSNLLVDGLDLAKTSINSSYVGSGVVQSHYQPVIIVVTERTGNILTFTFSGNNFTYQDIGLYKLRDAVVSEGSDGQSGIDSTTTAYTFSEY
jgi:hypothetical protein